METEETNTMTEMEIKDGTTAADRLTTRLQHTRILAFGKIGTDRDPSITARIRTSYRQTGIPVTLLEALTRGDRRDSAL